MSSQLARYLDKINTTQYVGMRSALYHFVKSTKIQLSLLQSEKCPMLRVLEGPPPALYGTPNEDGTPVFALTWCMVTPPTATEESRTVFDEPKYSKACSLWKELNSKFYGILSSSLPDAYKHLV